MWGVICILSGAEEIVVIKTREEELLFRWHSEHMGMLVVNVSALAQVG